MHNILEKEQIDIRKVFKALDNTAVELDTLNKELKAIKLNPLVPYKVPCTNLYNLGYSLEEIQVPVDSAPIIERLEKDISEREDYTFALLKAIEDKYTEGFNE